MRVFERFVTAVCPLLLVACAPLAVQPLAGLATLRAAAADGQGALVGNVRFIDSEYGLMIAPDLRGMEPGPHAAHIHEFADCGNAPDGTPAGAAGDHYDPGGTGRHAGPYGSGHAGDLPNLIVEADGTARIPILAPRLKVSEVKGRALMIHAGADRYDAHSSHRHGTGGARMYCGVIH